MEYLQYGGECEPVTNDLSTVQYQRTTLSVDIYGATKSKGLVSNVLLTVTLTRAKYTVGINLLQYVGA